MYMLKNSLNHYCKMKSKELEIILLVRIWCFHENDNEDSHLQYDIVSWGILPPSSKQKHAGFLKRWQWVSTLKIASHKILICIVLIIYQCGLKKETGFNPVIYL